MLLGYFAQQPHNKMSFHLKLFLEYLHEPANSIFLKVGTVGIHKQIPEEIDTNSSVSQAHKYTRPCSLFSDASLSPLSSVFMFF